MSCLCVAVLPKVAHHDYDGRHCMCTAVGELENLAPARPPSLTSGGKHCSEQDAASCLGGRASRV